jgi:orotate phosphoribosyltransferase
LAQLIAATLEIDFYFTEQATYRLAHGLQRAIRNQRVAVVDDAINAGSAVRGTLDELRSCGAVPVVVGALVVLGETGANYVAAENLPLECLATLPNQLWLPADCPFCAGGVPLEIGGSAAAADPS